MSVEAKSPVPSGSGHKAPCCASGLPRSPAPSRWENKQAFVCSRERPGRGLHTHVGHASNPR